MDEDYSDESDSRWRAQRYMELEDDLYADRLADLYEETPPDTTGQEYPFSVFD